MEIKEYAVFAQIATPFCILVGAYIASRQLRLSKQDKLIMSFTEALNHIADEKFCMHEGMLLRHWVAGLPKPLTVSEYELLDEKVKTDLVCLMMAHDRLAFILKNSGRELNVLLEWQRYEIEKVWINLKPVIMHMQGTHEKFCDTLKIFVEGMNIPAKV